MYHSFITGTTVYLRGIERADLEGPFFQWGNDEATTRYLFMGARPNTLENLQEWYDDVRHSNADIVFMVIDAGTDEPIGFAGLHRIEWISSTAEYRVFIGEEAFRGRGLGQEIAKLLVRYAFEKLNLNKVWLGVNAEHAPAVGSYEKAGFVREGVLRAEIYRNSRHYDAVRMSILRDEYYSGLKARYDAEIANPSDGGVSEVALTAALIGCGRIGAEFDEDPMRTEVATHAKAWANTPGAEFVAAADPDAAKLDKVVGVYGVTGYADPLEMLDFVRPDIVSVATPPSTHRAMVQAALEAGAKAIWCEKPMASDADDASAMIAECRAAGAALFVNHQRRFEPRHRAAREFVAGGGIGDIQQVVFVYGAGIGNTGTHALDLVRYFCGEVEWVEGLLSPNLSHKADDPNIDATMRFTAGALCRLLAVDVDEWAAFDLDLLGTRGRLRVRKYGFAFDFQEVGESDLFSGYRELFPAAGMPFGFPERVSPMLAGAAHIVDCLETGAAPLSAGEDGLAALLLIEALSRSASADGERIYL